MTTSVCRRFSSSPVYLIHSALVQAIRQRLVSRPFQSSRTLMSIPLCPASMLVHLAARTARRVFRGSGRILAAVVLGV